jgi:hypothetical protein
MMHANLGLSLVSGLAFTSGKTYKSNA